ncbi:RTA1 like protein [Epithele typhae]|uniref:RTA1 like protein n=1 Tax=Epithele typhae TaxID=378194 RepID=UPI002008E869|nr:RTA1 like protein [Epithele typhae]KAH9944345.1 RTA1 like protein [Epithele typhae]
MRMSAFRPVFNHARLITLAVGDNTTNLYGYTPSKESGLAFVVLFGITTLLHTFQATRAKAWWLFPTAVIAGAAEVVGWAARIQSASNPFSFHPYIIQITVLVLAPTPFVAALFIGLRRIVTHVGPQYSRLTPRWYSRIFLSVDILCLLITGGGGGLAATGPTNPSAVKTGSDIILVGLGIQIFSLTVFCTLMAEFVWRRANERPYHKEVTRGFPMDRNVKFLLAGITLSTFFIYVRSIYRIIEFAGGFNGKIAHTEWLFIVFDGVMITLGMFTLNVFHPGRLLKKSEEGDYELTKTRTPRSV